MDNELEPYRLLSRKTFSQKKSLRDYSNQIILFSFLIIIFLGAGALKFFDCFRTTVTFFDAFFMATSATCVTGLSVIDLNNFTLLGKIIMLLLIQIGGLGLMTLSFFLVALIYHELGVRSASIAQNFLSLNSSGNVKHYIFLIMKITLLTEFLGALILFLRFYKSFDFSTSLFLSIFYSVSAFCNAGICPNGMGLLTFFNDKFIIFTIQSLIFFGSIGFFVFYEIFSVLKDLLTNLFFEAKKFRPRLLSLHSIIVLKSFFYLTVVGTLFFLAIEKNRLFIDDGWLTAFLKSFVFNMSLRSAGFVLFPVNKLSDASLLFSIASMTIGAAPGSTGGGVKVTTFVIFIVTLLSILRGKSHVEIGARTISEQQVYKSISILVVALGWVFSSTFLLLLVESKLSFMDLLFETCSSLFNVGLSTGVTPFLGTFAKSILIINMIAGRIGILTFIFAIRQKYEKQLYKLPVETVILG